MSIIVRCLIAATVIGTLTGCSSGDSQQTTASASAGTNTEDPSPENLSTAATERTAAQDSGSGTAGEPGPDGPDAGALGLDDMFEPGSDWVEGRFDVAGRDQARGIAIPMACEDEKVNFRLRNDLSELTFDVGQEKVSGSAEVSIAVEVIAGSAVTANEVVPAGEVGSITADVSQMNGVRITLDTQQSADAEDCAEMNVVLMNLRVVE